MPSGPEAPQKAAGFLGLFYGYKGLISITRIVAGVPAIIQSYMPAYMPLLYYYC